MKVKVKVKVQKKPQGAQGPLGPPGLWGPPGFRGPWVAQVIRSEWMGRPIGLQHTLVHRVHKRLKLF